MSQRPIQSKPPPMVLAAEFFFFAAAMDEPATPVHAPIMESMKLTGFISGHDHIDTLFIEYRNIPGLSDATG